MPDFLIRTYKFSAWAPVEGLEAFEQAVALKRAMWAEFCAMEETLAARRAPIFALPKAERDQEALSAIHRERVDVMREIKRAYAARGLAWGDYNAVAFQFDGAVASARQHKALPQPDERALGDAVVRQLKNNVRPHHLLSRNDVCIEYLPPSAKDLARRQRSSRRSVQRLARLTFMIRSGRNPAGAAALTLNVLFDRPLPPSATLVEARVIRRSRRVVNRAGQVFDTHRWSVTFACRVQRQRPSTDGRAVGVALDWKGDGDGGSNLAVISDGRRTRTIGFGEAELGEIADAFARLRAAQDSDSAEQASAARAVERLTNARRHRLRAICKQIVAGVASVCVEKQWLSKKGVKNFTAPSAFRTALIHAAENAGALIETSSVGKGEPSKKRAALLRAEAVERLSAATAGTNVESDQ